jgi:hypothetical protein
LRGLVGCGRTAGTHFVQDDTNIPVRQLPSGFATR